MQIHVLGNRGAYPHGGGACSGYLVDLDGYKVLLDCGSGVTARVHERFAQVDAVILTHLHGDHMSDVLVLAYAVQNPPLQLYAPGTPAPIAAVLQSDAQRYDFHEVHEDSVLELGGAKFSFCRTNHPVECYAVKIEHDGKCFVYSGDTNQSAQVEEFVQDADLLLCDACFSQADWSADKPHLSAALAGRMARERRCKQLVITHFMARSDVPLLQDEASRTFGSSVQSSYPAMTLTL